METTNTEKIIINKYKDKIAYRIEKLNIIQSCVDLLKEEYKILVNENKIEEAKKLKIILNKHIRILGGSKGSITHSKKNISKIVCKNIYEYDNNLIMLIIDNLYDISLINMITSTKHFYELFKQESEYNIIKIYNNKYYFIFKIPKQLLNYYNIDLEQLFYIPITIEGRTLIHMYVRNNHINIMIDLFKKFPKLNINVGTTIDNWRPIHNSSYMGLYEMTKLLINSGIDYNSSFRLNYKYSYDNIIDYCNECIYARYTINIYKNPTRNRKYINIYNYIINNIDLHTENINKTPINYNNINENEYIMNILNEIYNTNLINIHISII